jgi:hypothetical protein
MHCFYWPERSGAALQHIAERAAFWTEARLVLLDGDPGQFAAFHEHLWAVSKQTRSRVHRIAAAWLLKALSQHPPLVAGETDEDVHERLRKVFHG